MPPKKRTRGTKIQPEPEPVPEPQPKPKPRRFLIESSDESPMQTDNDEEDETLQDNLNNTADEVPVPEPREQSPTVEDEPMEEEEECFDLNRRDADYTYVDEELIDVMSKNKVQFIANPKSREDKSIRDLIKKIRKGVNAQCRSAFQTATGNDRDIGHYAQRLNAVYYLALSYRFAKINMVGVFYNELNVRLTMMMPETTVSDHRQRVLKMVASAACEHFLKKEGEEFLRFVINFIRPWTSSDSIAGRINATIFATVTLAFGAAANKDPIPGGFSGYTAELAEPLYMFIMRALTDKDSNARRIAIKGMSRLQGYPLPSVWCEEAKILNPNELIARSCRDIHPGCRLTAVEAFVWKDEHIRLLSDIVNYDKNVLVRAMALKQLGTTKPNRHINGKLKLLQVAFKDHDLKVRESAKDAIRQWIIYLNNRYKANNNIKPQYDPDVQLIEDEGRAHEEEKVKGYFKTSQAICHVWLSDTSESQEGHGNLRRMIRHLLDVVRDLYVCHAEPIAVFTDIIMSDLREAKEDIPLITKGAIGSILYDSDVERCQDIGTTRSMVFFWRCMIDYIAENSRNKPDKQMALRRYLSPMGTMVLHYARIFDAIKAEEGHEFVLKDDEIRMNKTIDMCLGDRYKVSMSMVENLLSVMKFTESEHTGLQDYHEFLLTLLPNMFYQKKVIDIIVQELMPYYKDSPEDLLKLVYDNCKQMRDEYKGGEFPRLNNAVLIGEEFIRRQWELERETSMDVLLKEQGERLIDFYELMTLNALLKTDMFSNVYGGEWHRHYGPLIETAFQSDHLDSRVLATECIGIIAQYCLELVETQVADMYHRMTTEPHSSLVGAVVAGLTDNYVTNWKRMENEIEHSTDGCDFMSNLTNFILNQGVDREDSEILIKIIEALARLMLNTKAIMDDPRFVNGLVAMMYRASWTIRSPDDAKIRSIIVVFLKFYCSMNINHQYLMIKAFRRFYDIWGNSIDMDLLSPIPEDRIAKLKRCAATFVALTRHSNLEKTEQARHRPAHLKLIQDIIRESSTSSFSADYYVHCLIHMDFSVFTNAEQNSIYEDVANIVELCEEDNGPRYTELRRVHRKLWKLTGQQNENENENEEEVEDVASEATTIRPDTAASTRRGIRRQPSNQSILDDYGVNARKGEDQMYPIEEEMEEDEYIEDPDQPCSSSQRAPLIKRRQLTNTRLGPNPFLNPNRVVPPAQTPLREASRVSSRASSRTPASTPAPPKKPATSTKKKPEEDLMDIINSPPKVAKKPPSRPTTGSRRAPTPTNRTTPLRTSARNIAKK